MVDIEFFFVICFYKVCLIEFGDIISEEELYDSCYVIMEDDDVGMEWCEQNGYFGYISYVLFIDLFWWFLIFQVVKDVLDKYVVVFVKDFEFNFDDCKLVLEDLWINILFEGGNYGLYIYFYLVIFGMIYVFMFDGILVLKIEDLCYIMMMVVLLWMKDVWCELKNFIYFKFEIGDVLFWESWFCYEVFVNMLEFDCVLVSFNYKWE